MRKRDHAKLDRLAASAAEVFAVKGFAATKVSEVARKARIGPGTVYLYAADKEALFELAVLRACESPLVASAEPPYRGTPARDRRVLFRSAVEAINHFPQLWVGLQRRVVDESIDEYESVLLEIATWLARYRQAILIADRNRAEWPDLSKAFDELVWADLVGHLAAYLGTRMKTGRLRNVGDRNLMARVTLASLAGNLVGSPVWPTPPDPAVTAVTTEHLLMPVTAQ